MQFPPRAADLRQHISQICQSDGLYTSLSMHDSVMRILKYIFSETQSSTFQIFLSIKNFMECDSLLIIFQLCTFLEQNALNIISLQGEQ